MVDIKLVKHNWLSLWSTTLVDSYPVDSGLVLHHQVGWWHPFLVPRNQRLCWISEMEKWGIRHLESRHLQTQNPWKPLKTHPQPPGHQLWTSEISELPDPSFAGSHRIARTGRPPACDPLPGQVAEENHLISSHGWKNRQLKAPMNIQNGICMNYGAMYPLIIY